MASQTRKTVYVALAANASIAVCKGVVGAIGGSNAMLAEAAHSVADTVNQLFLLVSLPLADRRPDPEHPFGHGKDRFFWAFLAAVFIFVSGSLFSIGRGVFALLAGGGEEGGGFVLAYAVLAFSFLAEGASLVRAYRQIRDEASERGRPLRQFIRKTSDPTSRTVLFEDSAAVVGLLFAFAGVALHQVTGNAAFDSAASVAVGLLLGYIAVRVALDNRTLLLGLGAPSDEVEALARTIRAHPDVEELVDLRTMYIGPRSLLVAARVDFVSGIDADRVEEVSTKLEGELCHALPDVSEVFLDATRRRRSGTRPAHETVRS